MGHTKHDDQRLEKTVVKNDAKHGIFRQSGVGYLVTTWFYGNALPFDGNFSSAKKEPF